MMEPAMRKRLRAEGQALRPVAEVGKRGLDPAVVAEVDAQLKRATLVKVRVRPSAAEGRDEADALAASLAQAVGAEVVERRGHTVLLFRRGHARRQ